jgi:hypothetical protein
MCFKTDWTMCSKYANHSRFNSQHHGGWGDLYDYSIQRDEIFMGSENYEAYGYGQGLDVLIILH